MKMNIKPIGFIKTDVKDIPRHWSISDKEGTIIIDEQYKPGLKDIKAGQNIVVIFYFHESPIFTEEYLVQIPPHRKEKLGVFSTCSPVRPNPIGMSVVKVINITGNTIHFKGLDMMDGTPILDIKPFIEKTIDTNPS
jgi:tRNA-Thr(GGU) m(6)t(6)A37 methyltransferase TsaA